MLVYHPLYARVIIAPCWCDTFIQASSVQACMKVKVVQIYIKMSENNSTFVLHVVGVCSYIILNISNKFFLEVTVSFIWSSVAVKSGEIQREKKERDETRREENFKTLIFIRHLVV